MRLGKMIQRGTYMKKWRAVVGEPTLVVDSGFSYDELGWGPYQFPLLRRTVDGGIHASWHMSNDKLIDGKNFEGYRDGVTYDGGKTWVVPAPKGVPPYFNLPLNSGYYLSDLGGEGCFAVDWLNNYPKNRYADVPSYINNGYTGYLYSAEGVEEFPTHVTLTEIDPQTGDFKKFQGTVNWPNAPIDVFEKGDKTYITPISKLFALQKGAVIRYGDALLICIYGRGGDHLSGKAHKYSYLYSCFVLRSDDDGRTWELLSQVDMNDEAYERANHNYVDQTAITGGFCEPRMTVLPDGSLAMIMRTGSNMPSYITYSKDGGRSWTTPEWFDRVGVMPKLLTLGCGVTVAAYGRPDLFVRLTEDPSGKEWDAPISIELSCDPKTGRSGSCCYASVMALDDHSFMLFYSDFYYGHGEEKRTKVMLSRRVELLPEEA